MSSCGVNETRLRKFAKVAWTSAGYFIALQVNLSWVDLCKLLTLHTARTVYLFNIIWMLVLPSRIYTPKLIQNMIKMCKIHEF